MNVIGYLNERPQTGVPRSLCSPAVISAILLGASVFVARAIGQDEGAAAAAAPQLETAVFDAGVDAALWYQDHEIETQWKPAYLERLKQTHPEWRAAAERERGGRRSVGLHSPLLPHGVYAWPFPAGVTFTLGHAIQSYQSYGGTPYFHHGIDIMAPNGTDVIHRAGGQVVNIENYQPGNDLYWEVAFLDPDGYLWQYHHIDKNTIPQSIKNKFAEYQANPETGGFVTGDVYIGDIVYWTVVSFGKRFNHIHLNIFEPGGAYVNGFEFFTPLADDDAPEILGVGLLQNGAVYSGNEIAGNYSLYVRARDLVLDDVYWLPPYEVTFSVDGGPVESVWEFYTLPGGGDDKAYLHDYYVVPPTCGNYSCRDFYIDLGFIKDSQRVFPNDGGEHTVAVTAWDYAGNATTQTYAWTVLAPPTGTTVWFDDFETDKVWVSNPFGADTATLGWWERGNPEGTDSSGPKQLNATVSGVNALVTGRLAGSNAGSYDVDGGTTSIRSPAIRLPRSGNITLSFSYYFAHGNNSSSADYLRCQVMAATTQTVFEELGAADDDDAAWALRNVSLNAFAGQTVRLLFEAADSSGPSLVEAAVDDVLIVVKSVTPGTFYVTHAADGGEGSLRQAILGANAYGNGARVEFVEGLGSFTPASAWPDITVALVMDFGAGNALTRGLTISGGGAIETRGAAGSVLGAIMVSDGSLIVTDQALADCPVWVGDNGSLQGEGAVGELTIDGGGTLTPGASPGTINAGSTTWRGGGAYRWEINDAKGAAGEAPGWDLLDVSGALTIDADSGHRFVIHLATLKPDNTAGDMVNFDNAQDFSWTLVRTRGGVVGFAADKFTLDQAGVLNPLGGGSFALSVVGNDLVLSFTKAPPTAATLAWFRAWPTADGQVALEWQTLVEVDIIGFYLERSASEGVWRRVTEAMVPASGYGGASRVYSFTDPTPPSSDRRYRLLEVDSRGRPRIAAESALNWPVELRVSRNDAGLTLLLAGPPQAKALLEVAENSPGGPWAESRKVQLSDAGSGAVRLDTVAGAATRFYRARFELPLNPSVRAGGDPRRGAAQSTQPRGVHRLDN